MESSKENTDVTFDRDAYDWYLGLVPFPNLPKKPRACATWNAFVAHPNYDDYWKALAPAII